MPGQQDENRRLSLFVTDLFKTKEFRNILEMVITDFFKQWGSQGKVKTTLARHAREILAGQLAQYGENAAHSRVGDLLKDPSSLEFIRSQLPVLINRASEAAAVLSESLEQAGEDEQQAFIDELVGAMDGENAARAVSSIAKIIDSLHKNSPTVFADTSVKTLERVLKKVDFGDLKVVFENSEPDLKALTVNFNDLLFEYPSKLILFLSFIPGLSNWAVYYLQDLLKRFNELPADILTDLLISFFKELDDDSAGAFINRLSELIRQIHTGSALIGDAGTPQFSRELMRKNEAVFKSVNLEKLFRARQALIEGKESVIREICSAASENPSFAGLAAKHGMMKRNSRIRLLKQKFDLLEDLGEEEAASIAGDWLSEWNASEFAELVNSACMAANVLYQHKPDALKHAATEFINALYLDEIEESTAWISRELTQTLGPVIQTVAPVVIKDLIHSLETENGNNEEQINEMRRSIRRFILNGEGND